MASSKKSNARRRPSGSIRKLRSGNFQARYLDATGARHSKSFKSKGDADAFLAVQLADQLRGSWIDPNAGQILLQTYGAEVLANKTNIGQRTRELYEYLFDSHIEPGLGRRQLSQISPQIVRGWFADLVARYPKPSPTPAKSYRLLSQILKTAESDGLIVRNPCNIPGAAIEKAPERPVITIPEVWALADAIVPRLRLLVLLAAWCGFRRGELLALRRRSINVVDQSIEITEAVKELKSGERIIGSPKSAAGRRKIAIPPPLIGEIEDHLQRYTGGAKEDFLFQGARSRDTLRFRSLYVEWEKAKATAGLAQRERPIHLHDLRHTAGTLAASTGASMPELMHRLGHSSPSAALRYQHATQQRDRHIAQQLGGIMSKSEPEIVDIADAKAKRRAHGGHATSGESEESQQHGT